MDFDNFDNFNEEGGELMAAHGFDRHPTRRHGGPHPYSNRRNCRRVCNCGHFGCRCGVRCGGGRWFW